MVAQSGSVHVWGACGRRFKSCSPDQKRDISHNQVVAELFKEGENQACLNFRATKTTQSLRNEMEEADVLWFSREGKKD